MAQHWLKQLEWPDQRRAASDHVRAADDVAIPVPSPARALHATLDRQLAPAPVELTPAQKVGAIAVCASLSWLIAGCGLYTIIR